MVLELCSFKLCVDGVDEELIVLCVFMMVVDFDEVGVKINLMVLVCFMNIIDIDVVSIVSKVFLLLGGQGLVLNYDLLVFSSQNQYVLGGLFDVCWFFGSSVFSFIGLGYIGNSGGVLVWLELIYIYLDVIMFICYWLGDVINSSLVWSCLVCLGGFQYVLDFNL